MSGQCEKDGLLLTPLSIIPATGGDVLHGMKASSLGFDGFGEAYFSEVYGGAVKGWKKHTKMTVNLIVVHGEIRFRVVRENRLVLAVSLSPNSTTSHQRLTIYPGAWVAFGGIGSGKNMLINIANIEHDTEEAHTLPLDAFEWSWT